MVNGTFYLRGILSIFNEQLISRKIHPSTELIKNALNFSKVTKLPYVTPASTLYQPIINHSCLFADECINAGEDMLSASKCFRLTFRKDGDLVIVRSKVPNVMVWATNTRFKGGIKACMLRNGNFVMFNKNNLTVWNTHSKGKNEGKIVRTCVHDDGKISVQANDIPIFVIEASFECL